MDHLSPLTEPDPGPGCRKLPKKVQQTCNLASMQAQLSELQKMFCKDSEAVNVSKQVLQHTGVSFLDSKDYFIKSR